MIPTLFYSRSSFVSCDISYYLLLRRPLTYGILLVDRLCVRGYTVINLSLSTTRLMLLVTRALAFASVGMLAEIFRFVYLMNPIYFIQNFAISAIGDI